MRNEYTDERLPGVTLVNTGDCLFEVLSGGVVVSTFTTWEKPGGCVSESFARRMAADYFDQSTEPSVAEAVALCEAKQKLVRTSIENAGEFNAPPSPRSHSREIESMLAREKTETDPAKRATLRHNILLLMKKEESVARLVVRYLTEDAG